MLYSYLVRLRSGVLDSLVFGPVPDEEFGGPHPDAMDMAALASLTTKFGNDAGFFNQIDNVWSVEGAGADTVFRRLTIPAEWRV